jgi:hypothetical protein
MIPSSPIYHKPKSILAAKNILYAAVFLGAVIILVIGMSRGFQNFLKTPGWIAGTASLVVVFIFVKQIELGKKWARTLFLIFFILEALLTPFKLISLLKGNFLLDVLFLIQAILQIFALKFLFTQKSTLWFISARSASQQ